MRPRPVGGPPLALAAALLALLLLCAGARADGVGFRDIAVEADGVRLKTALWYPIEAASGETAVGPFVMAASRDAPVAAGRHPLVLISHGTGSGRLNHRGTAIRLAGAGYIVAAPDHAGDYWRDGRLSGTSANWRRRPQQLRAVLDRLLGDAEVGPHIDPARIGAIGHSAGGYSVLALIGGRPDLAALALHCTTRRAQDPGFCAYGRPEADAVAGTMPDFSDLSDPRVRAVVAVAPVGALFGAGAFAGVGAPAQIHRLGADRVLRRPWHADNIAALMGEKARLVVHPEAHHFAFIAPVPPMLTGRIGEPALDPPGFDRRAFLSRIDGRILDFLDEVLPAP